MNARAKQAGGPPGREDATRPLCALVGRPNVGKSSLFNRLVGGRPALVEDVPGVTRDRRYGVVDWIGARFRVVDTGGLDPSAEGILGAMRAQTLRAVDEAQVLVFVVDAVDGLTAVDQDVAQVLRRAGKPVLVAANKVDSAKREGASGEVFALGFPDVFAISAAHGRGVSDLLDAVIARLGPAARTVDRPEPSAPSGEPDEQADEQADEEQGAAEPTATGPIRIAFVGKPNVGKSSLVNRLLGEERVLVHDQPGTTRDPIDTPFSFAGREYVLVDTAGLRRRRTIESYTEAVAAKMARDQLQRADVAALVIDAQSGATAEDARLASLIEESGRAMICILNKKDLVSRRDIDTQIEKTREELSFVGHAPVLLTSAVTGAGVSALVGEAARVYEQASRRIPTAELNRLLEEIVASRPPPAGPNGRYVRLYYATQASVRPPTFYVSTNQPGAIGYPYRRFLTNQLRKAYGFEGVPIRLVMKEHRQKRRPGGPRGDRDR